MAYPTLIDNDRIVATARAILEQRGAESVTLRSVADALGVKTPSLYRYFDGKNALLRAVNEHTIQELFAAMSAADAPDDSPVDRLVAIARAYRRYAHDHPVCYDLAMSSRPEIKPSLETQTQLVLPLQELISRIAGTEHSLAAIRGASALVHGWASLEITQQLRRGGDLDADFEQSFRSYIRGLQSPEPEERPD